MLKTFHIKVHFHLNFSICNNCLLLRCTTWCLSMAYVFFVYALVLCVLLCPLADLRFGQTCVRKVIWKKKLLLTMSSVYFLLSSILDSIVLKHNSLLLLCTWSVHYHHHFGRNRYDRWTNLVDHMYFGVFLFNRYPTYRLSIAF